nr:GGDEF domain-containing protein [uncultured Aminipila sp.]
MMLDIDYFKKINDTYGHVAGDNCLVGIASSITKSIMQNKGLVIRFGGEEFLITFYIKNIEEADGIVEKILEEIRQLDLIGNECKITSSLGACIVPCEDIKIDRIQDFIKIADKNLYQAKNNGRNQHYITKYDGLSCKKTSDLI